MKPHASPPPIFRRAFFPHNAAPGLLRLEGRIPSQVRQQLEARGHTIEVSGDWSEGDVLGICVDLKHGIVKGGADLRGEHSKRMPSYVMGW